MRKYFLIPRVRPKAVQGPDATDGHARASTSSGRARRATGTPDGGSWRPTVWAERSAKVGHDLSVESGREWMDWPTEEIPVVGDADREVEDNG